LSSIAPVVAAAAAAAGLAERPHLNAHFRLAIDGLAIVDFSECSGLAGEVSVEEYAEGGENRFAYRLPSRASFPNLVLSRGVATSRELWDWYGEYLMGGRVVPREGQVQLLAWLGGALIPARVWAFTRAYPVKMTGPDLNAQSPAVAIESLELAHHGLQLVRLFT
jgi:phage tail-like protein